jgi:hypothetical protein
MLEGTAMFEEHHTLFSTMILVTELQFLKVVIETCYEGPRGPKGSEVMLLEGYIASPSQIPASPSRGGPC